MVRRGLRPPPGRAVRRPPGRAAAHRPRSSATLGAAPRATSPSTTSPGRRAGARPARPARLPRARAGTGADRAGSVAVLGRVAVPGGCPRPRRRCSSAAGSSITDSEPRERRRGGRRSALGELDRERLDPLLRARHQPCRRTRWWTGVPWSARSSYPGRPRACAASTRTRACVDPDHVAVTTRYAGRTARAAGRRRSPTLVDPALAAAARCRLGRARRRRPPRRDASRRPGRGRSRSRAPTRPDGADAALARDIPTCGCCLVRRDAASGTMEA